MRDISRRGASLLVASTGGHLTELYQLRRRFSPVLGDVTWATFDTEQSRHLLADETVTYVPFVRPKDARGTLANVSKAFTILRRGSFDRVISTGAAIAVPFLAEARLLRIPSHYIESAARSEGPSLSGRMVGRLPGVRLYGQYPGWATPRWQYRGAVFDGYAAGAAVPTSSLRSVVVTFGTQRGFGFRRAAERLVALLPEVCEPSSRVLWQTGATDMSGLAVDSIDTMPAAELEQAVREADLVISHAGVGSALLTLESGRCPLLVPRRRAHREHTDDHQLLIAQALAERRLAVNVEADSITADALLSAAAMRAVSVTDPPRFVLQSD